jgi:hypothetical membrane protein
MHSTSTDARVAGALALVAAGFVLAGAFPIPQVVHAAAGAVILFGIPLLLAIDATRTWRRGREREAIALATGALVTVAIWLPYDLGLESLQIGYALAEIVAFTALAAWTLRVLHQRPRERSTSATTEAS